jgi:hypothetical protein
MRPRGGRANEVVSLSLSRVSSWIDLSAKRGWCAILVTKEDAGLCLAARSYIADLRAGVESRWFYRPDCNPCTSDPIVGLFYRQGYISGRNWHGLGPGGGGSNPRAPTMV